MKRVIFLLIISIISLFGVQNQKFEKSSMMVYPTDTLIKFLNKSRDIKRVKLPILIEFFGPVIRGAYISTSLDNYESSIISIDMSRYSKNPFEIMHKRCPNEDKCIIWMSGEWKNSTLFLEKIYDRLADYMHGSNTNIYLIKK